MFDLRDVGRWSSRHASEVTQESNDGNILVAWLCIDKCQLGGQSKVSKVRQCNSWFRFSELDLPFTQRHSDVDLDLQGIFQPLQMAYSDRYRSVSLW